MFFEVSSLVVSEHSQSKRHNAPLVGGSTCAKKRGKILRHDAQKLSRGKSSNCVLKAASDLTKYVKHWQGSDKKILGVC